MATRQIPWARVLVEGVVIVASILLALTADAWWDERQEREEEQELLLTLREEFRVNRDNAARVERNMNERGTRFQHFRTAPRAAIVALPSDSVRPYYIALESPQTFDPVTGSVEAVINSGKLGLIQDTKLRSRLSQWLGTLGDLEESKTGMLEANLVLVRAMEWHGGPFRRFGPTRGEPLDVVDAPTLARMRDDEDLMGAARLKHRYAHHYKEDLGAVAASADSTLIQIDASIR